VRQGTTSRVMVASRQKVSFWPGNTTSPGNYGYHICINKIFLKYASIL
jgi:hypothetical protein